MEAQLLQLLLSDEETIDFLITSLNAALIPGKKRNELFRSLIRELTENHILRGEVINNEKKIFVNFARMPRNSFYDLVSNIYLRFFGDNIPRTSFVKMGIALFHCNNKAVKTIYNKVVDNATHIPPEPYNKYFH